MTQPVRVILTVVGFALGVAALGMSFQHNEAQWAIAAALFFLVAK